MGARKRDGGRRLVVAAAFDVVNFTALVEADEERVLAAWRALRAEIDPVLSAGGGRIFKSLGDGLLVEFTSPVEATRTALLVQETIARTAPARAVKLELRAAIHMGEVTVEGTDLLGDGINIVARLQEHAPVGGVLVSAAVMDLIAGRIEQPIEELGPLRLRNIRRPVHAYAVGAGKKTAPAIATATAVPSAIESFQRRRPSIAVLPFVDQAADGGASWFADGLVEDIITALGSLPELIVISRSSVLQYRGLGRGRQDPRQISRELNVRYLLSGTVRRSGDKVRLSAELSDCETGRAIWSDRFAGGASDLFQLQDELSAKVVTTIVPQVQESELRRCRAKHPDSLDAYECVLRGLDLLYRPDPLHPDGEPYTKALPLFERALALDPRYATAYALAATCHGERFYEGTSPDPRGDHMEAERLSRLALSFDRFDPLALSLCGHIRSWLFRDYDHAIELFDRALAANPSAAIAWTRSSATFAYIGEPREAKRRVEIGLRLSPYDAQVFFSYGLAGLAAYAAGEWAEAAAWGRRAMASNPRFVGNLRFLAAALAANGELAEAREVGQALLAIDPRFRAGPFAEEHAFKDAAQRRLFGEHLVKAGLPA